MSIGNIVGSWMRDKVNYAMDSIKPITSLNIDNGWSELATGVKIYAQNKIYELASSSILIGTGFVGGLYAVKKIQNLNKNNEKSTMRFWAEKTALTLLATGLFGLAFYEIFQKGVNFRVAGKCSQLKEVIKRSDNYEWPTRNEYDSLGCQTITGFVDKYTPFFK